MNGTNVVFVLPTVKIILIIENVIILLFLSILHNICTKTHKYDTMHTTTIQRTQIQYDAHKYKHTSIHPTKHTNAKTQQHTNTHHITGGEDGCEVQFSIFEVSQSIIRMQREKGGT